MTLTDADASLIVGIPTIAVSVWLARRNARAKKDAMEKLVEDLSERLGRQQREEVQFLRDELRSKPKSRRGPSNDEQRRTD